jgi:hypothetical protein
MRCTPTSCTATPPSPVAGPALAPSLPRRKSLRGRPRQATAVLGLAKLPPCRSALSRHASAPSAHARTARVLGRIALLLHPRAPALRRIRVPQPPTRPATCIACAPVLCSCTVREPLLRRLNRAAPLPALASRSARLLPLAARSRVSAREPQPLHRLPALAPAARLPEPQPHRSSACAAGFRAASPRSYAPPAPPASRSRARTPAPRATWAAPPTRLLAPPRAHLLPGAAAPRCAVARSRTALASQRLGLTRAPCTRGRKREGRGKEDLLELLPVGGKKKKGNVRIMKRREEEQMDFPNGLNAISENYRDLFVKQNFPSI